MENQRFQPSVQSALEEVDLKRMCSELPTVLFLVNQWAPGGVSKHVDDLCHCFRERGLNCVVAAWHDPDQPPPEHAEFFDLPLYTNGRKSILGFCRSVSILKSILADKQVVIIHTHSRYATLLAALACKGKTIGQVYTAHNIFTDLRYLPWYPQNVICLNEAGRKDFLKNRFLPANLKIEIVPNGVEVPPQRPVRASVPQSPRFTYIGRLEKQKGVDLLILAAGELRETDIQTAIVGSGAAEQNLRALARDLGLIGRVEFLGYLDNPGEVIEESTALVLPATMLEGFGYVVIEAFAKACPVIASDLEIFNETVIDGVTGLRFRNGDYLSLADAMRRAVSEKTAMEAMGANGYSLACEKFTVQQMAESTLNVYQSSIGSDISLG
jgi:glycosyltransferase involved in cell wall biosynthesis